MKGLLRGSFLLVAALVLIGAGLGVWYVTQPAAEEAPGQGASLVTWPKTQRKIRTLEQNVRRGSAGEATYTRLGYAYVQAARKTGDWTYEDRAEDTFAEALERDPKSFKAMNGMGNIFLRRHQFGKALAWGQRARAVNPERARTYGLMVDAYIELGQYDDATRTAQQMVNLRPDLASYSRVSYIRELTGDLDGAIDAMKRAVSAGSGSPEHTTWTRVYLGHLYFKEGNLAEAEKHYDIALQRFPYYGHALAGLARVRMSQGRFDEAVGFYERAVEVFPIGEYIAALGRAYRADGQPEKADAQYDRAVEILEGERKRGMGIDGELAWLLLKQDGNVDRALALAQDGYERRPTVKRADILAWAQYKAGQTEKAHRTVQEALRLGTKAPLFYYHAGMIAERLGRHKEARQSLQQAVDVNPHSVYAKQAQISLASFTDPAN